MEATVFQDIGQFIEPTEGWRSMLKAELLGRRPKTQTIELVRKPAPAATLTPQNYFCGRSATSQLLTPQKQKTKATVPDSKIHSVLICPFLKLVLQ